MQRNSLSRLLAAGWLLIATGSSWATVTIKGKNETVQIKLPDGWKESGPPPSASESTELCAVQQRIGAVLLVNVQEATDETPTLDSYLKVGVKELSKAFGEITIGKSQTGKVNQKDCLRCELRFAFDGDKVGAVVSIVKVETHYEMVTVFTAIENFNRMKSAMASLSENLSDISTPIGPDVTLKGKDGLFQLTFTGDWKQQPVPINSPPSYQLLAQNWKQHAGLEVISIPRADTTEDLPHLLNDTLDSLSKELTDFTHTDPASIKINGFDALRCEATGSVKDVKLAYMVTAIQTPTQMLIVDASCSDKNYARLKPILSKPLATLKELTPAAKVDPNADDEPALGRLTPLKNKDGTVQIGLPHGWKSAPPPPGADKSLQITADSLQDGADLMVVVDDRKATTLKQYTEATLAAFTNDAGVSDLTHTDPATIKINGKDAAQLEIHCTANGTRLAYLVTILPTEKSFLRSQFYTTESKFAKMKPIFIQLAQGLKQGVVDDNSDDQ